MSDRGFLEKLLNGASVAWKPLGDIAQYSKTRISSENLDKTNYVGVDNLLQNRAGRVDSNYVPTSGNLTEFRAGDILIGNIRPYLRKIWLADRTGGTNGDVLVIHPTDDVVNPRYLYQVLTDEKFFEYNIQHSKGAKMPRGSKPQIIQYPVPIPCPEDPKKSREIQAEIVRILDNFTELTAELTAELKARKQQYNYYLDHLLSFEGGTAEWKSLDEIGEFIRGKRFTKADYVDEGIDVIHYGEIYTRYGVYASKAFSQVNKSLESSLKYAEPGDVVLTDVGETVDEVGKPVAWLGEEKVAIHDHCYAFRHELNAKYVAYCMQASSFVMKKSQYVARTKVNTLLIKAFGKAQIPVPYPSNPEKSLAEQARIVSILDKFNTLTTSLSEGLPREIRLRQQQYEYYRDLLLSFPKPEEAA